MSEVKRFGYFWDGSFDVKDDGAFIRYEDYAELKAQRDALAAENARMKKAIKRIFPEGVAGEKGGIGFSDAAKECFASAIETPATDAQLRAGEPS